MCGIAAIVHARDEAPSGAIERMTGRMVHRGPDAEGFAHLPGCHLGHRRLSVIDLAGGAQPMTEETGRYWVVLNGEIYNFRELRAELEDLGWRFRTRSDTEVLLRMVQQYGERAVSRLNGQFAFAVWDQVDRKLFAARDRLGEKPLYWAVSPQGEILLASEPDALLASGLLQPRIDRRSVDAYLALMYIPPDRTVYENMAVLQPGHAMVWEDGRARGWSYWSPALSTGPIQDPRDGLEHLRFLIDRAVERQMVADVKLGAFLSGGLDSSTIVALMTRHTGQPVSTFSVGFEKLIDELPYARGVARRYGTDHHEIQMDIPVGLLLERMAEVYGEPFADSSNIPTYLICQYARRYVTVALSGDGGDELFGGYEWYRLLLDDDATRCDSLTMARLRLASLVGRLATRLRRHRAWASRSDLRFRRARAKKARPDPWERHVRASTFLAEDRSMLWRARPPDLLETLGDAFRPSDGVAGMDVATDFDARCYLPGDILVKVDRAAMAHGLETRAPFLDVDLLEFVLGLPWRLRFQDGQLKHLLREACSPLWPDEVRARSKQGFGAPVREWIARPDVARLIERVFRPSGPLVALLPGVITHPPSNRQLRWALLCLGLWIEKRPECL